MHRSAAHVCRSCVDTAVVGWPWAFCIGWIDYLHCRYWRPPLHYFACNLPLLLYCGCLWVTLSKQQVYLLVYLQTPLCYCTGSEFLNVTRASLEMSRLSYFCSAFCIFKCGIILLMHLAVLYVHFFSVFFHQTVFFFLKMEKIFESVAV